jgi:hypothetical protein
MVTVPAPSPSKSQPNRTIANGQPSGRGGERAEGRQAHAVLLLDRAGWHTTSKLDVPANITPIFLPSRSPGAEPGRERLAVSPPELALKHRLRKLKLLSLSTTTYHVMQLPRVKSRLPLRC